MWVRSEYYLERTDSARRAVEEIEIRWLRKFVPEFREIVESRPDVLCAAAEAMMRCSEDRRLRSVVVLGYALDHGDAFERRTMRFFVEGPDLPEVRDGELWPVLNSEVKLATDADDRLFREAVSHAVREALKKPRRANVMTNEEKVASFVTAREGCDPVRYVGVPEALLADALGSSDPIAFAELHLAAWKDAR